MIVTFLLLLGFNIVLNSVVNVKIEAIEEPVDCQGFLDKYEVRPLGYLGDKHSILQPNHNH